MEGFIDVLKNFIGQMGFAKIGENWGVLIMMALACVLLYAAIVKKWEPMLLLPIAFGMLLTCREQSFFTPSFMPADTLTGKRSARAPIS